MSNIATALSGLQNVSLAIDTVSNNIANANTIGYKSGEYVFATQFLNGRLATSLLGTVHRDEAVPEANANQMSVFKYAQSSSVAADIDAIARNIHRMLPKMNVNEYKKYNW